ncbi:MAG: hypothetical protein JST93_29430 [Acidobacteria bacterium]|nr:hypothetical protein [Acidobacteriota bacterium]
MLPDLSIDEAVTRMPVLLNHQNESVRTAAVLCAIAVSSRGQLERLISAYQDQSEYYYNVVTWLDRYLYAPKPVFDAYVSQVHNPWHEST